MSKSNKDKLVCAPSKQNEKDVCFSLTSLQKFSDGYNKFIKKNGLAFDKIDIVNFKKKLMNQIVDRLNKNHNGLMGSKLIVTIAKEFNLEDVVNDIHKDSYPPNGPNGDREWLNTDNIDDVMYQYMTVHKDFLFLGAVPIDCYQLSFCATYKINFDEHLKKGYTKVGLIPNLDRHNQRGSHWVAIYFDLKTGNAYFYDPTGHDYPKILDELFNKFENFCSKHKLRYNLKVSEAKHQRDTSECGIYSMNFIIRLLRGEKYEYILLNKLSFNEINSCRLKYFGKHDKFTPDEVHEEC
jgi:hypothetical protein